MSSSLFGGGPYPQSNNPFNPFGGFTNFLSQINQFRAGLSGDPHQMVDSMVQSGQMSQEQFNYFSNIANQMMPFFRR